VRRRRRRVLRQRPPVAAQPIDDQPSVQPPEAADADTLTDTVDLDAVTEVAENAPDAATPSSSEWPTDQSAADVLRREVETLKQTGAAVHDNSGEREGSWTRT
jgi:hypothetical protein